ncbi:MAG TPA: hypothetical protein VM287_04755 [Egibacteraceae bacterium]|nr:hypothetical protein [Egibacteraceae bacterium]
MPDTLADHDIAARPDGACLLHRPPPEGKPWHRADPGYATCSGCLDRLRDRLADIVARYHRLAPTPGASGDHRGRGAPGYGSRPPVSLHVIAMRDPRSGDGAHVWLAADGRVHTEPEHPPLSVRNVLETLAVDVAEQRGITPPDRRDVPHLAGWIDRQLDWITRRPLVVDVDTAVRNLVAQLAPVTGDPARRPIGTCPNTVDDGDHTRECGARLYAPTNGDTIRCSACGRAWPRDEWLRLGDLLQAS